MILSLITVVISFVIAAVIGVLLIPMLHKLKFGQEIREEGPKWHQKKSGTPTMGGLIFITAMIVTSVVIYLLIPIINNEYKFTHGFFALIFACLGFGAIGFIDDYIKVILKRNLGLTALQKFSLQFIISLVFSVWIISSKVVSTEVVIPFMQGKLLDLGIFCIPFLVLVMLATVNSVNLTDGLDGLATCVTIVVTLFFCIMANLTESIPVAVISASTIGSLLGFLLYNKYPAKVFMGDTGSLFLGGVVSAVAIYMQMPLILLIAGFVYVMESLSVIMQVTSFKLTGKRIFKMSPIHHHFEMCGWNEVKIVLVFTLVTVILCIVGGFAA